MCTAPWQRPDQAPIKCGQCVECRLAYSREWAIRITHEQMMHEVSCMVTLTYDDDHLPAFGQLEKADLQKFFKRLRKALGGKILKYVAAGEYGDKSRRPHFHVALFGHDFSADRVRFSSSVNGDPSFKSALLGRCWSAGGHDIGSLNFESAAYIARYVLKKVKGPGASALPLFSDPESGELVMPNPEFLVASKGVGKSWFREFFMTDVYPHARVITAQGSPAPVPRYYKNLLKDLGTDLAFDMSARTLLAVYEAVDHVELSPARREARATVSNARSKRSVRSL